MLTHIHIWNFAIVESLDIEFENGLTVMTGETGAGKSILLDALGLALGDRADTSVIRHGCDKAEISVTFNTVDCPQAQSWLEANEMASDDECIIRRTIANKGASKAFINGVPSTVQQLRELGEMLVDLHGQHEHQSLLSRDIQRELLDDYAENKQLLMQYFLTIYFSVHFQLKRGKEEETLVNLEWRRLHEICTYYRYSRQCVSLRSGPCHTPPGSRNRDDLLPR